VTEAPAPEPVKEVAKEPVPIPSAASNVVAQATEKPQPEARLVTEIGSVTSVTERETNKVMDKLDMISQLLEKQKDLITGMMGSEGVQNPTIKAAIHDIMAASSDIQNKVYEAMDLMQFQDITRQKLERIIHHLRQIHDYIVDLLGTGFQSEQAPKASISRTIAQTGTTPDESKHHADSVVEEFIRTQKKD
jgi:chemotaxis regulatin CheY-phosphate phosphatase CheZ